MKDPTLYDALVAAGCELDHHESDLYVRDTAEARHVLTAYKVGPPIASTFRSQIDGQVWWEVPFAYRPFWDQVSARSEGGRR